MSLAHRRHHSACAVKSSELYSSLGDSHSWLLVGAPIAGSFKVRNQSRSRSLLIEGVKSRTIRAGQIAFVDLQVSEFSAELKRMFAYYLRKPIRHGVGATGAVRLNVIRDGAPIEKLLK